MERVGPVLVCMLLAGCVSVGPAAPPAEDVATAEAAPALEAVIVDVVQARAPNIVVSDKLLEATPVGYYHGLPVERTGERIASGHRALVVTATWSPVLTGVAFGYAIDGGDEVWFFDVENGVPFDVDIPSGADEPRDAPPRWEFVWNPSSDAAPGTGASVNAELHVRVVARS